MTSIYGIVSIVATRTTTRKAYREIVDERAVRRNRALGDTRGSIINLIAILAKAVPMKAGRLVPKVVVYTGYEPVPFGNVHLRWRKLAIDSNHRP